MGAKMLRTPLINSILENVLVSACSVLYIDSVPHIPDPIKTLPAYSMQEAAHFIGMSKSTMQIWLRGRHAYLSKSGRKHKAIESILPTLSGPREPISFLDLITAHVLMTVSRGYGIPMKHIRSASEYMKKLDQNLIILAHKDFYHDRKHVFLKIENDLISLSERGQKVDEIVISEGLQQIVYGDDGFAERFYPKKKNATQDKFVLDPNLNFGKLSIERIGVGTEIIATRFVSGERISEIASDYNATNEEVEEAIRWHERIAA